MIVWGQDSEKLDKPKDLLGVLLDMFDKVRTEQALITDAWWGVDKINYLPKLAR